MRFAATRSSMRRAMASSDVCCGCCVAPAGAGCVCATAAKESAKQDATRNARRRAIIFRLRVWQSYAARSGWSRERIAGEAHHQRLHAFRERRVHELGIDDRRRFRACLHERDEDVDQLPGLGAAEEDAEDPFAVRIEEDLAASARLVHFPGAGDVAEVHRRDLELDSLLARLPLGEADAGDLRVGEDGVRDVPAAPPALPLPHEDVEEDAMVVPGGVRELRPSGHVADGVGSFVAGAIAIVDADCSLVVEIDPALVATEVVGVRAPADGDQQVRAARLPAALEVYGDVALLALDARDLRAWLELDPFLAKRLLHLGGDVRVLATEQVLCAIDDGDAGAEAPEHLRELAADVAPAEDHEVRGKLAELHQRTVVQPGHARKSVDGRLYAPRAGVDDDGRRGVDLACHFDAAEADESSMTANEHDAGLLHAILDPLPPLADDRVLAIDHGGEVDPHFASVNAQPARRPGDMRGARARHHRFRRRAADVDAGPSELLPLDEDHLLAGFREASRERHSGLTASDDEDVGVHDGHLERGPSCRRAGGRARSKSAEVSRQLGAADQLAEARIGAQALEVFVRPEHSLAVEPRVEGLAEPLEGAIGVTLPRLGAGEIVERRGLSIAQLQCSREMLRGLRLLAGVEARVTGVEERPARILVLARVGLEPLRRLLPGLDVRAAQRTADAQPRHGEGFLHLCELLELRVVVEGGEIGIVAQELGIVEAAFHRALQLDQRRFVVALEREGASRVVERSAGPHRALRGFAERVGRAVVLASLEELLADRGPGIGGRGRVVAHLLEARNRLARARLAFRALLAHATDEVAEAGIGTERKEIVVVHEEPGQVEAERRGLRKPSESGVAIAEPGIAASDVVGGLPGPLVARDGLAEGLDRFRVPAFAVERHPALVEARSAEIGECVAYLADAEVRLGRRGRYLRARLAGLLRGLRGGGMHGGEQERDGREPGGRDAAGRRGRTAASRLEERAESGFESGGARHRHRAYRVAIGAKRTDDVEQMPCVHGGPLAGAEHQVVRRKLGVAPYARRGDPGERMEPPQRQSDFAD